MKTKIELNPVAHQILKKRYLQKDDDGKIIETPEQMFQRVAENIAQAEDIYGTSAKYQNLSDDFYKMMAALEFLPNSPTLMNAGRQLQQLSACFVLPVDDSLDRIFETVKDTAIIHKSGGGTGFNFSSLRPQNDFVQSTKGISSGPVSFMLVFDAATEAIKQGGTRRGANMAILNINHPDIFKFVSVKKDHSKLTNFNISVGIPDKFFSALRAGQDIDLINPRTGMVEISVPAKTLFELITDNAWEHGEPGLIFLDRIEEGNPTPDFGHIESTNPCGEQPLLSYEACTLGSINLSLMVKDIVQAEIDWEKLGNTIRMSVHFLDNCVDMTKYPLKKIEEVSLLNRKIGLGVMGFADMLIKLKIPYDSHEAVQTAKELMGFIQKEAHLASIKLAKERGSFPNFQKSIYANRQGYKIRNATVTTIAPAGTISLIAGTSSGIEPVFNYFSRRRALDTEIYELVHPILLELVVESGLEEQKIIDELKKKGSPRKISILPDEIRRICPASFDVSCNWHIKIQAAFQEFTDNAVSKTINLPVEATREDVAQAFNMAFDLRCKGITVYRHHSRENQVLDY